MRCIGGSTLLLVRVWGSVRSTHTPWYVGVEIEEEMAVEMEEKEGHEHKNQN